MTYKRVIPTRYYEELISKGNTVPRNEKTGELIPFVVGRKYTIKDNDSERTISAKCTQDCPYNLLLLTPQPA